MKSHPYYSDCNQFWVTFRNTTYLILVFLNIVTHLIRLFLQSSSGKVKPTYMQVFFQDVTDISKVRVRLKGITNNTVGVASLWNIVQIKLTKIIFPFLKQK